MRLLAVAPNPSIDRFFGLDRLAIDAVNRPQIEVRVAGGKALNVARVAALLGVDVAVIGILAGHAGRWVADELEAAGVRGRWVWVDGETRSCVAIHESSTEALTELNEAGPQVERSDWERLRGEVELELLAGDVGLVAICGSLPPGAPDDGVAGVVGLANSHGVRTIVDGSGRSFALALAAGPWMAKVNRHEALEAARDLGLAGDRRAADSAGAAALAEAVAAATGGCVIVTLGTDGAVAAMSGEPTLRVSLPAVRGPYPVGSGDAFLAGLAAATLADQPLEDALRLGAGAAAANALEPGAGRLDPTEAVRLAAAVRVEHAG